MIISTNRPQNQMPAMRSRWSLSVLAPPADVAVALVALNHLQPRHLHPISIPIPIPKPTEAVLQVPSVWTLSIVHTRVSCPLRRPSHAWLPMSWMWKAIRRTVPLIYKMFWRRHCLRQPPPVAQIRWLFAAWWQLGEMSARRQLWMTNCCRSRR